MEERQQKNTDATLCYHIVKPSTEANAAPGAFLCESSESHPVLAVPKGVTPTEGGSGANITFQNIASLVDVDAWGAPHDSLAALVWLVRWEVQGLKPQRPQIMQLQDVTIKSQTAIRVSK